MSNSKKDKLVSFLCGDAAVTAIYFCGIFNDLGSFALKVIATIILGVAGGVAGMVGKDLYNRYKIWKSKKQQNGTNNTEAS